MRLGSISPVLLMCGGGGVRSIPSLPLVTKYLETIDVCIWRMFAFMSVVVIVCVGGGGVCGNACCVAAVAKDESGLFEP